MLSRNNDVAMVKRSIWRNGEQKYIFQQCDDDNNKNNSVSRSKSGYGNEY